MVRNSNKIKQNVVVYSSLILLGMGFILFLFGCSIYLKEDTKRSINGDENEYFNTYNLNADIQNFQFIHAKNGIVVEWKFENNKVAKAVNSPDWIRVNQHYLVRAREKLRLASASKKMKSDEYSYLDVFDLTNKKASKKEVNAWKLMVNYLKNDNFELVGTLPTLRRIENNDYVVIRINDQLTYRYFLLNLKTLKIDKETTEEEINEKNRVYLFISTRKGYTAGVLPFDNGFWKEKSFKGDINLRASYPTAFKLFSKPEGFAYKVINSENGAITNGKELIDLETEFLTLGSSVYDYAYLPKELSIENKDTKISQFDEIQQYYNGKSVSNWH